MPTCARYILFSSPRSGSTWTCQLLDMQRSVHCGLAAILDPELKRADMSGEYAEPMERWAPRMMAHSQNRSTVSGATWQQEADAAFEQLERQYCSGSSPQQRAVGWKLMHLQFPPALHPSERYSFLSEYLVSRNVSIVSLVREATVLRIASGQQSFKFVKGKVVASAPFTTDASVADKAMHSAAPIQLGHAQALQIHTMEREDDEWDLQLRQANAVRFHRITYEALTGPQRHDSLREAVRWLGIEDAAGSFAVNNNSLKLLHEPSCRERVANWTMVRRSLEGTRCVKACDELDARSMAPKGVMGL